MITYKGNTIGILNDLTETQTLSTHGKFLEDNITISPDLEEYDGSVSSMVTYKTFTVRIDTTNSNSLTCVTYEDDAVGMTKGSSAWDSEVIFKDIKPCMFASGEVVYYLNPANFNYTIDGDDTDMSGADGDVMIEFPKFGYWIRKVGTDLLVSITDNPDAENYCYDAFTRVSKGDLAHFYQGAYKGYYDESTGKLRSKSGVSPITDIGMSTARSYAMANGTNYYQSLYCHIVAIQCLYLIKYGNLNSQEALGMGYTDGWGAATTGATDTSGMCAGNPTDGTIQVKLFGIEDFWGNIYEWVDGIITDSNCNYEIFILPDSDGNPITDVTAFSDITSKNSHGYISDVAGTNQTGFAPIALNGSSSTFWADYGQVYQSQGAAIGGLGEGGIFSLMILSNEVREFGGRICYH